MEHLDDPHLCLTKVSILLDLQNSHVCQAGMLETIRALHRLLGKCLECCHMCLILVHVLVQNGAEVLTGQRGHHRQHVWMWQMTGIDLLPLLLPQIVDESLGGLSRGWGIFAIQWQPSNRPCKVHRKVVVDYSHPAGVTSLPLGKLIHCLDVLPHHGSSSRPIVSVSDARAKLATGDEKLEERVYVFYSAERETRAGVIPPEDEFEKLSDPGNVLFESIVGVCAFLFV